MHLDKEDAENVWNLYAEYLTSILYCSYTHTHTLAIPTKKALDATNNTSTVSLMVARVGMPKIAKNRKTVRTVRGVDQAMSRRKRKYRVTGIPCTGIQRVVSISTIWCLVCFTTTRYIIHYTVHALLYGIYGPCSIVSMIT